MHRSQCDADKEVCGVLGAAEKDGKTALSHYPIKNIAESSANSFLLCPEGQIAAQKSMRENEETLFAMYHSHPTAPATPSDRDYNGVAGDEDYSAALHLIISLNTKGVLEIGGWRMQNDKFDAVELDMIEEAKP